MNINRFFMMAAMAPYVGRYPWEYNSRGKYAKARKLRAVARRRKNQKN